MRLTLTKNTTAVVASVSHVLTLIEENTLKANRIVIKMQNPVWTEVKDSKVLVFSGGLLLPANQHYIIEFAYLFSVLGHNYDSNQALH